MNQVQAVVLHPIKVVLHHQAVHGEVVVHQVAVLRPRVLVEAEEAQMDDDGEIKT